MGSPNKTRDTAKLICIYVITYTLIRLYLITMGIGIKDNFFYNT